MVVTVIGALYIETNTLWQDASF